MRILIPFIFIISACTNTDNTRKHSDKSLKNTEEQKMADDFKSSGKGLYYDNCNVCHSSINSTVTGKSFVNIVNSRSVEGAYSYLTDSSILKKLNTKSEHADQHPIYMNTLSKQDLVKIWEFVHDNSGPVP